MLTLIDNGVLLLVALAIGGWMLFCVIQAGRGHRHATQPKKQRERMFSEKQLRGILK
jgi:hypothetical protein